MSKAMRAAPLNIDFDMLTFPRRDLALSMKPESASAVNGTVNPGQP